MARISKSPIGELSGKVGNLVFKQGKNGPYVSEAPTPTTKKPSAVQQLQRDKMTVVMDFLRPFQRVIKEAYFPFQKRGSGFHAAKSYYLKEAVTLRDGEYVILYSKTLFTFGDLLGVAGLKVTPDVINQGIILQWADNSHQAMAYPDDQLLIVAFVPETDSRYYKTHLALRENGHAFLPISNSDVGKEIHIWAGFCRPDDMRASPSTYGGSVLF